MWSQEEEDQKASPRSTIEDLGDKKEENSTCEPWKQDLVNLLLELTVLGKSQILILNHKISGETEKQPTTKTTVLRVM